MLDDRKVDVIKDRQDRDLVLVNQILFRGRNFDWSDVKVYLKGYIGDSYVVKETGDIVYIGNRFPTEYTGSENRIQLQGAYKNAKANAVSAIPELIQTATNPNWNPNKKIKHEKMARNGWYRFDVRFALPVYEEEILIRYNIYHGQLVVNHAENNKKYLYDILSIKKETSSPQQ